MATRLKLLTVAALLKEPPPEWLLKGVLPKGGFAVNFGQPGHGKTFVALEMCNAVASGREGAFAPALTGAVVYIAGEGRAGLQLRIRALLQHHGVGVDELGDFHVLGHPLNFMDEGETDALIGVIRALSAPPVLIVIDTLARCFGDGDENSTRDMNVFVRNVDRVRLEFGAAVLVVHHGGKTAARGARGSSSLQGAADTVLEVSKQGDRLTLRCSKQKDGEPFPDMTFSLLPVPLPDGKSSCVLAILDGLQGALDAGEGGRMDDKSKAILEALERAGGWMKFTELERGSGVPESTLGRRLPKLEQEGRIEKGEQGYRLRASHGDAQAPGEEEATLAA